MHIHIFNLERLCLHPSVLGGQPAVHSPNAAHNNNNSSQSHSPTKAGSPAGVKKSTRSTAGIGMATTNKAANTNSSTSFSLATGSTSSQPKHTLSLYEKTVLALLEFWTKVVQHRGGGQSFAGLFGGELAFLCIPLCGSHQVIDFRVVITSTLSIVIYSSIFVSESVINIMVFCLNNFCFGACENCLHTMTVPVKINIIIYS